MGQPDPDNNGPRPLVWSKAVASARLLAWIEAKGALYILDSGITGGRVVSFDEVTPAYVFANIETYANTGGDKL